MLRAHMVAEGQDTPVIGRLCSSVSLFCKYGRLVKGMYGPSVIGAVDRCGDFSRRTLEQAEREFQSEMGLSRQQLKEFQRRKGKRRKRGFESTGAER